LSGPDHINDQGQGIGHGDIARSEAAFAASFSMAMPGLPKAIPRTVPMPRRPFSILFHHSILQRRRKIAKPASG
jgi:hypothetical protein